MDSVMNDSWPKAHDVWIIVPFRCVPAQKTD